MRPLALVAALLVVGCGERPRAPAIARESVYQNDKIGLRFATPDGWIVQLKADLPTGPLPKPVLLVSYLSPKGEGLQLQVEAANAVPDTDVEAFLSTTKSNDTQWKVKEPRTSLMINGVPAVRWLLTRSDPRGEQLREVTVFQRGDRTYVFTILFNPSDRAVRDQANLSVQSVEWQ